MTFVYELDSYSLEIHWMCKYKLPKSRLSKVIVWQTDRHTESTEIIKHAALRVVKIMGGGGTWELLHNITTVASSVHGWNEMDKRDERRRRYGVVCCRRTAGLEQASQIYSPTGN